MHGIYMRIGWEKTVTKNGQREKRVLILEALSQCLQEKPYTRTTIKDIAKTAGVNHGLLHYYFTNKEDILIHYIDHVISHHQSVFENWMNKQERLGIDGNDLLEAFFDFMKERIVLNRKLSRVFIEIWEIGMYNPAVRMKLQSAYRQWFEVLAAVLERVTPDKEAAGRISTSTVAFLEGMALFSTIFEPGTFDFDAILADFRSRIIKTL